MNTFWTISLFWAFVLVAVGVALGAVLPTLLRREAKAAPLDRKAANIAVYQDQLAELKADLERGEIGAPQYEDARLEIEKRLSEDVPAQQPEAAPARRAGRWMGFALAGVIPVAAIGLYIVLGNPDGMSLSHAEAAAAVPSGQHDAAPMLASLEAKLKQNPNNPEGWIMLGRSYETLDRPDDAARAFAKAVELLPGDAGVLADYAEALALAQGKVLAGKPLEYVNKALQLNPADQKALELAAIAAEQARNFPDAAAYWRKLLKVLPPDSDYAREVKTAAEQAERAGSNHSGLSDAVATAPGPAPASAQAKGSGGISGTVVLGKELMGKVSPTDTVFVVAKALEGSRMPLGILRIEARQLPYRFTLDDSSTMMPGDKLSNHPAVMLGARVSKSGDAVPRSGDLQGKLGPVNLGQRDVTITIDSVVP